MLLRAHRCGSKIKSLQLLTDTLSNKNVILVKFDERETNKSRQERRRRLPATCQYRDTSGSRFAWTTSKLVVFQVFGVFSALWWPRVGITRKSKV